MKRFIARLSALFGVLAIGAMAIAQAQRMVEPPVAANEPAAKTPLAKVNETRDDDVATAPGDDARPGDPRPMVEPTDTAALAIRGQGGEDPFTSAGRGRSIDSRRRPSSAEPPATLPGDLDARAIRQPSAAEEEAFPDASDVLRDKSAPQSPAASRPRPGEVRRSEEFDAPVTEPSAMPASMPIRTTGAAFAAAAPAVNESSPSGTDQAVFAERQPARRDNDLSASPADDEFSRQPPTPTEANTARGDPRQNNQATRGNRDTDEAARGTARPAPAADVFARPPSALKAAPQAPAAFNSMAPSARAIHQASGRPGDKQLEGVQAPSLSIEKRTPEELQVGQTATIVLKIRNTGAAAAHDVVVRDRVPQGAQLVSTSPRAETGEGGELVWSLGTLSAGSTTEIKVQLKPVSEGEIGSVASVVFRADASFRVRVTQPRLALDVSLSEQQVMLGSDVTLSIRVSNVGTGLARDIVLVDQLPPQVRHPAGSELEYDIGTLKPGESRDLDLTLTAAEAGKIKDSLIARGVGDLQVEEPFEFEIIAPSLKVAISGPARRYLERKASYTLSVSNPGTAVARDVRLVAYLPEGMKFADADHFGEYDSKTGTVEWLLDELPPEQSGNVVLSVVPMAVGKQKITIEGSAKPELTAKQEATVEVDGVVALFFEVADVEDPVEVGGQTTYEIRIVNQGTKTATNLEVVAVLPDELQAVDADGPTRHVIDGGRVLFDPMPKLAPKADTTYHVRVQASRAGDLRFRVQVRAAELSAPVTKEESTRVYSDQ